MGAIEDLRKVIQDLVTPDLKAIAAKLDMLEKRMDGSDSRMGRLDGRMDKLESSIEQKFERAERNADARMNQLFIVLGLAERVKRLEEARQESKEQ